jgi:hypothetical protein
MLSALSASPIERQTPMEEGFVHDTAPALPYLELHLTDHCNLNCKGCTHFCPIADENYLQRESFVKDMRRLAEIFPDIFRIRLLGGEPLLHPSVAAFAGETRRLFPESWISIVTNGILLPSMGPAFYESLLENKIALDISVYPATKEKMEALIASLRQYCIPVKFTEYQKFYKTINPGGNSDMLSSFARCPVNGPCTFFSSGRIYHCCMPALAGVLNGRFGLNIPNDDYIDIHTPVTAAQILDFLKRPSSACAYCARVEWFPWQISELKKEEWIIGKMAPHDDPIYMNPRKQKG